MKHRVDLDSVEDDGPRTGGRRAELLRKCRALMQADRDQESGQWTFIPVGEDNGGQVSVRAAQLGDSALVDRLP